MYKRILSVVAAVSLMAVVPATTASAVVDSKEEAGINVIFEKTNSYREEKKVKALKGYDEVDTVAQKWADYLSTASDFYHNPNFFKQMPSKGLTYGGENIAYACGYGDAKKTAEKLMVSWRNSSGHYANIMNSRYTHIGIGYNYNSKNGCGFAVQNFGDYSNLGSKQPDDRRPAAAVKNTGPFLDVNFNAKKGEKGYHQFASNIKWAYENNITKGYTVDGGKVFRPETSLDRGAMAAFLYRQYGQDDPVNLNVLNSVKDVNKNHQFAKPIAWMIQYDISTGYADGTYKPNQNIDRDAMAAFLYRIAQKEGDPTTKNVNVTQSLKKVKDITPKSKFAKPIAWMIQNGISTGYADGTYKPKTDVSRGATVTFLKRMEDR